jgi:hypothetical protein
LRDDAGPFHIQEPTNLTGEDHQASYRRRITERRRYKMSKTTETVEATPDVTVMEYEGDANITPSREEPPSFEESVSSEDIEAAALESQETEDAETEQDEDSSDLDDLDIDLEHDADDEDDDSVDDDSDESDEDTDDSDSDNKLPRGVTKRLNKLTKKMRDAERERDELRAMLDQKQAGDTKVEAPAATELTEPSEDDFDTYDEYEEAKTEYRANVKLAEKEAVLIQRMAAAMREKKFEDVTKKGRAKWGNDFDKYALNKEVTYSEQMRDFVLDSDQSHKMAYYLGKHKDVASRIASLPVVNQVKELAVIEFRIKNSETKTRNNSTRAASKPIKTVKGGTHDSVDECNLPMADFEKRRTAARIKRRKSGLW